MRTMKILTWIALVVVATAAAVSVAQSQNSATADSCAKLTGLKLHHVEITGAAMTQTGAAYCKILGTAKPTTDSDIRFEVLIPEDWNGRYLQVGNGGFAGTIPEAAMIAAAAQGYAVAGTDDGHVAAGTDASWAMGHPEKQIDFGY